MCRHENIHLCQDRQGHLYVLGVRVYTCMCVRVYACAHAYVMACSENARFIRRSSETRSHEAVKSVCPETVKCVCAHVGATSDRRKVEKPRSREAVRRGGTAHP